MKIGTNGEYCFKTLKLQDFCKMVDDPFMMSFSKVFQNSFKVPYLINRNFTLAAIFIFDKSNPIL